MPPPESPPHGGVSVLPISSDPGYRRDNNTSVRLEGGAGGTNAF